VSASVLLVILGGTYGKLSRNVVPVQQSGHTYTETFERTTRTLA
jgi:hypothetical protein